AGWGHLDPAQAGTEGGVHALLEAEVTEVELHRLVLVADRDSHCGHISDAHGHLLCSSGSIGADRRSGQNSSVASVGTLSHATCHDVIGAADMYRHGLV